MTVAGAAAGNTLCRDAYRLGADPTRYNDGNAGSLGGEGGHTYRSAGEKRVRREKNSVASCVVSHGGLALTPHPYRKG